MNRFEGAGVNPAQLHYLDAEYQVIKPGNYVICAVTGNSIPLDELKYWSVARQEPYIDVVASVARERELNPKKYRA